VGIAIALVALPNATANEFMVARICLYIAALMLSGATILWQIDTDASLAGRLVVGCLIGLLIFVAFPISIRWVNGRSASVSPARDSKSPTADSQTPSIEPPTPHLQAELIIDSVRPDALPFHLRITNIGDLDVIDLNIDQNASVVRTAGPPGPMLPVTKILPKRGHVSMQGIDPRGLAKIRQLYATLTYKCAIKGEVKDFLASCHFTLPDGALMPQQVIDQRSFNESTGRAFTSEDLRKEITVSLSDAFAALPVGTISFFAPEKTKTGEPNYVKITNETRTLFFDPVAHQAWFSSKPVSEALVMSFEPKDRHYVACNLG
jgi:hypothetical protein